MTAYPDAMNTLLDHVFYNVGALTEAERAQLTRVCSKEGAFYVVSPQGNAKPGEVRLRRFYPESGEALPPVLCAAGVGSSDVGACALARDVADVPGCDVLAVISGYGLSDVVSEALGRYFLFGSSNAMRRINQLKGDGESGGNTSVIDRSPDVAAVAALLKRADVAFELLVGHSKGNLLISEALYLVAEAEGAGGDCLPARFGQALCVSLGAVVDLPEGLGGSVEALGRFDVLGWANFRHTIAPDVTGYFGHHTNTAYPFYLDVRKIVKDAVASASPSAFKRRAA